MALALLCHSLLRLAAAPPDVRSLLNAPRSGQGEIEMLEMIKKADGKVPSPLHAPLHRQQPPVAHIVLPSGAELISTM